MEVSVIIPVRDAASFIERSATSLFEQTLPAESIEYIFIDDGSSDKTLELLTECLAKHPQRYPTTRILHHRRSRGQAAARNSGLASAVGDYVAFCDADDWVDEDIYERLLKTARQTGADVTGCDFYKEFHGSRKRVSEPLAPEGGANLRLLLENRQLPSIWNKLIRRSLLTNNSIYFPEGVSRWEDLCFCAKMFWFAGRCAHVKAPLYHYNVFNPDSLLNRPWPERHVEGSMERVIDELEDFFHNHGDEVSVRRLDFKKLTARLELRRHGATEKIYPEADRSLRQYRALSPFWRLAMYYDSKGDDRLFRIMNAFAGELSR